MKIQNYYVLNGSYPTATNFTTAIDDINLKVARSAYETQAYTYNLYYCAVTTGTDARFGLAARSVSLQKYAYISPGSLQLYTGTWTANGNTVQICPGLGISDTDPNLAVAYGYRSSGGGVERLDQLSSRLQSGTIEKSITDK